MTKSFIPAIAAALVLGAPAASARPTGPILVYVHRIHPAPAPDALADLPAPPKLAPSPKLTGPPATPVAPRGARHSEPQDFSYVAGHGSPSSSRKFRTLWRAR
jgi:hypothetical protein